MNIYAEKGTYVKYIGCDDSQASYTGHDPRDFLVEGNLYEILKTNIGSWSTEVYLVGFENYGFNSVCFED